MSREEQRSKIYWSWIRPALQGECPALNLYDRDILEDIRIRFSAFGNDAIDAFKQGSFASFVDFRWGKRTNRAIWALIAQEIRMVGAVDELWFRIGETNIGFGAREFALMTGLLFGTSEFDPNRDHPIPSRSCLDYYKTLPRPAGSKNKILPTIDDLHKDFKVPTMKLSNSVDDYVKIAEILFIYRMLFCHDGKRYVDPWVVALVEDRERWKTFPWGSLSFSILLYQLSVVVKSPSEIGKRNLVHIYGPIWVLEAWAYEAIPDLARSCAQEMKPCGVIPRYLRWSPLVVGRNTHFTEFFFSETLRCIKLQPTEEEERTEFWKSVVDADEPLGRKFIPYRGSSSARRPSSSRPLSARHSSSRQERVAQHSPSHEARSTATVIADPSFFANLYNEWKTIHPDYEEGQELPTYDDYERWSPRDSLVDVIRGVDGSGGGVDWWDVREVICICWTPSSHWVTLRIDLVQWHVELFDSLMHQMQDSSDPIIYLKRDRELMCITRLLPRLLHAAGYWERTGRERRCHFLSVVKVLELQYLQVDSYSCGAYAMMQVDRMVMDNPPPLSSMKTDFVAKYRRFIGARILNWCINGS